MYHSNLSLHFPRKAVLQFRIFEPLHSFRFCYLMANMELVDLVYCVFALDEVVLSDDTTDGAAMVPVPYS